MAEGDKMIPKKSGVSNAGLKYETQIIATLAARWGNNDKVEDFWIATSLPSVDCFDDINAIVIYKDKRKYLFMIQLKHSGKNMKLVFENTRKQRDFFAIELHKYKSAYDKITAGDFSDILKEKVLDISDENKYYCIFTIATKTRELAEKVIAKDDPLELLDISDRRMYSKWENSVPPGYDQFFNRLYFLTDQLNSESIPELLHPLMPAGFNYAMMSTFFNLVENANPLTTNIYSQQCVDVQMSTTLKISKILKEKIKEKFLEMWDQIFNNYDLIIIDKEDISKISSLLSSYYEYKIRKKYSNNFDWNACCENNFQLNKAIGQALKAEDEKLKFKHLGDLIQHMWNKSEIPVMLEEGQTRILTDPILKKAAVGKRFLLTSEYETISMCQDMKKVTSIADLKENVELIRNIFAIEVSLQGRSKVPIGKIIGGHSDILKAITPNHLLNWTSTNQEIPSVGKKLLQPKENYIPRNIYDATSKRNLSEKQFIQQLSHGLNVISNDAGMGKTTVLTSLAFQCEAADYVICYNLADYLQSIRSDKLNDSFIDIFFKKEEGENCSKLIKSIYESQKATQRVVLIIDSFDEISLNNKEVAVKILGPLLQYKIKFLIATRPYMVDTLREKCRDLKLFHLRELTHNDIENYFDKCNLSKTVYEIIDTKFLMIPLHLSMIASIGDNVTTKNTTKADLYELIIESKIDVYCHDKEGMNDIVRKTYSNDILKLHEKTALKFIFNVDMKFEKVWEKRDMCMSMGIISSVDKDSAQFQHHTYAEYLAAKWIYDNPKKSSKLGIVWLTITKDEYSGINEFLIEIRNKKMNCPITLNKSELLKKDQWGLLPIYWAFASFTVGDYDQSITMRRQIKKILIYMINVEELCVLESPNLGFYFNEFNCSDSARNWPMQRLEFMTRELRFRYLYDSFTHDATCFNGNCLHAACFNGNIDTVHYLLEKGVNVNQANRNGATALHAACLGGHENIVNILLEHNANPNLKTKEGSTSLHKACIGGHEIVVSLLLAHDADLNQTTSYNTTCLQIASYHGNVAVIRLLLDKNVDVNKPDMHGMSSLHIACKEGYDDIVKLLLANKADPSLRNNKGNNCLHIACIYGHENTVSQLLVHGVDPHQLSSNGTTCLYISSRNGNVNIVRYLLQKSKEINQQDYNGNTSLHIACEEKYDDIVKLLVEHNADLNIRNNASKTCLYTACKNGSENIVLQLLDRNADPYQLSNDGESCLHASSKNGNVNVVRKLLEKNLNVNQQDKNGDTSLHNACRKGYDDIVNLLLEHEADPDIRNNDGYNCLSMACMYGHENIVLQLLDRNADLYQLSNDGETCLHTSTVSGYINVVRYLLKKNLNVNQQDKDGNTSLHNACRWGHDDIVNLLLEQKADPNIRNNDGYNCLSMACKNEHENIVLQLLDRNADPYQMSNDGETCLHTSTNSGYINVVRYLLKKNLNVNQQDKDGDTSLHNACRKGYDDIVNLLLEHEADPDIRNNDGYNCLSMACKNERENIVLQLLDRNADPYQLSNDGETCLHISSNDGNVNVVRYLLEKNLNVNQQDKDGNTSLHNACRWGHDDIVNLLLEQKADPNIRNNYGYNCLYMACIGGCEKIAWQLLTRNTNLHSFSNDGKTCLHAAAKGGNVNIVHFLLKNNLDVNQQDKNGITSLHIACREGYDDIVNLLLEHKADSDIRSNDGYNCLDMACNKNSISWRRLHFGSHEKIVWKLLAYNTNLHLFSNDGETCLHAATRGGSVNIIHYLLKKNLDVNQQDKNGNTSLHIACEEGFFSIAHILLEHKADPNIQNNIGINSFQMAHNNGHENIISYLLAHRLSNNVKPHYDSTSPSRTRQDRCWYKKFGSGPSSCSSS